MITLLTDFGTTDYFVPAVKSVIHSLCPQVAMVDLTHDIEAQDVLGAAFTLAACYQNFPTGTIHLAVVDPGVGSDRRAIVVEAKRQYFVGPDNGIFSFVYAREKSCRVFELTQKEFFRQPVSPTFHGRDVFAPIAAWLAKGITPEAVGVEIFDPITCHLPVPEQKENGCVGQIIHIDHFGNCITNLTLAELAYHSITPKTRLHLAGLSIHRFGTHFSEAPDSDEVQAYLGSAGYWEIALWQNSAARTLAVRRGDVISLQY